MKTANPRLLDIRSNFPAVAWPPVLMGEHTPLAALLHELEKSQWLPLPVIIERQFTQLRALAEHAYVYSPYFKKRMDAAGLTPAELSPETLPRLGILARSDIHKAGLELYCREIPPSHQPHWKTQTSGSTGHPVTVLKTGLTVPIWHALTMREHFWHKRDFKQRAMTILSQTNQDFLRQKGWGKPVGELFDSGEVMSLPITWDIAEQVRRILEFAPHHLLVYPNNLKAIIAHCEREGISLPGVEHIWTRAETLMPELRAHAEKFFGARVEDNYSSEEIGIMALQCPESGLYHVMCEGVILEVLNNEGKPCKPGESGRVIATVLHNFATPMVRYAVGDIAEMGQPCSCGRELPTLKIIHGRERNLITRPDGSRHWPRAPLAEFKLSRQIIQHQMVQHTPEEIELRLVASPRFTAAQETEMADYLNRHMGYPYRYRITYYDDKIPPGPRGKFEEFMSLVGAGQ